MPDRVSAEVAAALTLTGRAADALTGLAREARRLPAVHAALLAGQVDVAKARVFAAELAGLGDVAAARIAGNFTGRAAGWTTSQLRRALRAAVLAEDPDAAQQRAAKARDQARVENWQEGSGNAGLAGRELPAADAIAANQRISQLARALKAAGVAGTMDQLRAHVYLQLLLGRDPSPPGQHPAAPGTGMSAGTGLGTGGPGVAGALGRGCTCGGCSCGGAGAGAGGLAGMIHLTLPAVTWLGLAGRPGELAGLGPVDPQTSRDLADLLAANGNTSWHLTLTAPGGQAVAHSCARGQPPGADPPGNGPPGDGLAGGPPGSGPPGSAPAVDARGDPRAQWLAGLKLEWLERRDCGHSRQTTAYQPGVKLRHLLAVRNPTCVFPGCRRPAARCDNEHTIPFDKGGRTCECNCGPMCRQHHQVKQATGWHLEQPTPGVFVWTAPSGRNYRTSPGPYPV